MYCRTTAQAKRRRRIKSAPSNPAGDLPRLKFRPPSTRLKFRDQQVHEIQTLSLLSYPLIKQTRHALQSIIQRHTCSTIEILFANCDLFVGLTVASSVLVSLHHVVRILQLGNNHKDEDYPISDAPLFPTNTTRIFQELENTRVARYFEHRPVIKRWATSLGPPNSMSAYDQATVVHQAPWFHKRRQCKETCCVETVAISLDQDATKIINTADGKDLADVMLEHVRRPEQKHLTYHASGLNEQILPCLVPGIIIFIGHLYQGNEYFWKVLRPKIKVPYVLVLTGSDLPTPFWSEDYMDDPLLKKLYGTNPNPSKDMSQSRKQKHQGMSLGLSRMYPQEKYLRQYLHLTNYDNPFQDKSHWDFAKRPFHFEKDVFVHFGIRTKHRQALWEILCPTKVTNRVSCNQETAKRHLHDIYTQMSQYRFGISPVGKGWDCYRSYESLLLGVIPVVDAQDHDRGKELFQDLPVVFMPKMESNATSQQDFTDAIQTYIASDEFQTNSFEEGWKRLFLHYWRRKILKDAGRQKDILLDENGREFYQAFQYSVKNLGTNEVPKEIFCQDKGSCVVPNKGKVTTDIQWLPPKLTKQEEQWLADWKGKQ